MSTVQRAVDDPTIPVGLPDVQNIWVGDLHVVCLSVQEVKEVFDGLGGSALRRCPPDRSEQVLHKRMHRHLIEGKKGNLLLPCYKMKSASNWYLHF